MRKALPLVLALIGSLACDSQKGYVHSPKQFTDADKKAISRVQQMPLGKIGLLNSIAAEYADDESPELAPCDYEVGRIIRRDKHQIEGKYPEEIEVICTTSTKESGLLRFVWVFDPHLERISEFKFGFDPSEFDPPDD